VKRWFRARRPAPTAAPANRKRNLVRIESSENIVRNVGIFFLRKDDGSWLDVRRSVRSMTVTMMVGELSRANIELFCVDATVEALRLDDETQASFAHALIDHGWQVTPPGDR
jgi:hypothetical protein